MGILGCPRSRRGLALVTGLFLALSVVIAQAAESQTGSTDGSPPPFGNGDYQGISEAERQREIAEWREQHAASSPEAREESAGAYTDLPRSDARELVEQTFSEYLEAIEPPDPAEDPEVVKYLSDNAAVVRPDDSTGNELEVSTTPLRVEDEATGALEEVDPTLEPSREGFSPEQIGTEITFPSDLADGVQIGEDGNVALNVADPSSATAPVFLQQSDALFYGEIAEDVDLLLSAMPGGLRFAVQVRSAASPERIVLPLDLPEGARIRENAATFTTTVEIPGQGDLLISPAVGVDADDRSISTELTAEGNKLVLQIDHRALAPLYPLLIDPTIVGSEIYHQDDFETDPASRGWAYWEGRSDTGQPEYNAFEPSYGELFGPGTATGGLFVGAPAPRFWYANNQGAWYSSVPNRIVAGFFHNYTTARFTWVRFDALSLYVNSGTAPNPHLDYGIFSWNDNTYLQRRGLYGSTGATDNIFDLGTGNPAAQNPSAQRIQFELGSGAGAWLSDASQYRFGYLGGVTTYMGDGETPSVSASAVPSGAWTSNPPSSTSFTMNASDNGLGIKTTMMRAGDGTPTTRSPSCAGWHSASPCPQQPAVSFRQQSFNQASLSDGIHSLYGRAIDVLEKDTGWITLGAVRNDRTKPASPTLSGPLAPSDQAQGRTLRVHATDAHSGVKSVSLSIDGQAVPMENGNAQPCPNPAQGGCSRTATYEARPGGPLDADGAHSFTVTVTDQVNGTTTQTWSENISHPNTTLTSTPPMVSRNLNPVFGFQSSQLGSSFACRLDGAAITACSSLHREGPVSSGTHTFEVIATGPGADGWSDPSPATFTFIILPPLPSGTDIVEAVETGSSLNDPEGNTDANVWQGLDSSYVRVHDQDGITTRSIQSCGLQETQSTCDVFRQVPSDNPEDESAVEDYFVNYESERHGDPDLPATVDLRANPSRDSQPAERRPITSVLTIGQIPPPGSAPTATRFDAASEDGTSSRTWVDDGTGLIIRQEIALPNNTVASTLEYSYGTLLKPVSAYPSDWFNVEDPGSATAYREEVHKSGMRLVDEVLDVETGDLYNPAFLGQAVHLNGDFYCLTSTDTIWMSGGSGSAVPPETFSSANYVWNGDSADPVACDPGSDHDYNGTPDLSVMSQAATSSSAVDEVETAQRITEAVGSDPLDQDYGLSYRTTSMQNGQSVVVDILRGSHGTSTSHMTIGGTAVLVQTTFDDSDGETTNGTSTWQSDSGGQMWATPIPQVLFEGDTP